MNAERLLAHFERISEAPDAVARLRRFILDLAVRGKLVEPPKSWLECTLGEVGDWGSGGTPLRTKAEYYGGDIPWLVIGDLNDGLVTASATSITEEGLSNSSAKVVDEGTLLIAMYGSIGKLGVAGMRCATNQAIAFCRPYSDMVTADYLFVLLKSLRNELLLQGQGVAQQNISQKILKAHPVELPPLAEQHRIVAKVNELMALCDQLEAARNQRQQCRERLVDATLQRLNQPAEDPASFRKDASFALQVLPSLTTTPAQIKQLRQTILNLAVRGKLVEQDPEDEPAEELLACFAEAKVKQKKRTGDARIKLEDDPSPDALPMTLPVGWKCQSFQNLFLFIDYRGNTPTKTVEGVPLITAKNVRMGRLDREPREFVSQSTYESWMTRGYPGLGDIFFTTEAPLGNACLNNIEQPFALAQRVICFQPYAFICTRFIVFALMSDLMQTMIDVHATGMTAKGIKAAKLKPLPIPLPPLAEQHRIVAKVDELMALCDQLEQQLNQADQQRRRLLEAVLAEALGGKLPTEQVESHAAIA